MQIRTLSIMSFVFLVFSSIPQSRAQGSANMLEDDEYKFSVMTPTPMTLEYETLKTDDEVHYVVYSGNLVDEWDTFYYRIDIWENPMEDDGVTGMELKDEQAVLDSTLVAVQERLKATPIYVQKTQRNGWPARLARYDIAGISRKARVLLVKRKERYYILTAITVPSSAQSEEVQQFLHSFRLWE